MKKHLFIIFFSCFVLSTQYGYAQSTTSDYDYTKEFIYGFNKSTNGGLIGGFFMKWGVQTGDNMYRHIQIEASNVKDPKEVKASNQRRNFTFGKKNYFYVVRGAYGLEKVLFRKAAQKGVQVNGILAGGPSIGVLAPYFVKKAEGTSLLNSRIVSVPYTADLVQNQSAISGAGNPFAGLGQSSINMGLHVRAALAFEFGAFKRNVTGFEAGFMLEAFTREADILHEIPDSSNRNIFPSAFVTLFYGIRK